MFNRELKTAAEDIMEQNLLADRLEVYMQEIAAPAIAEKRCTRSHKTRTDPTQDKMIRTPIRL
jgi:hypothetical protein